MAKVILFIIIVLLASIGLIYISNQNMSKPDNKLDLSGKTTPAISNDKISPVNTSSPSGTTKNKVTPSNEETKSSTVTIKTSKGDIVLSLYPDVAPKTVENFVNKSKSGFYNNLTFHRVEDWVIQGGDPKGNGTGGGDMPVEFNTKPFIVGSLGVASRGDGKIQNDAQFFITKKESSWLNGQYTNFGIVTKGMDVVNKMEIGDKILGITTE